MKSNNEQSHKTFLIKLLCFAPIAFSAILVAGLLQSCGGTDNSEQVAELQMQLDTTMQRYQRLKSMSVDFESELSSRDSAITAQAAEIQNLINELNAAKKSNKNTSRVASDNKTDNSAEIARQQKDIREKEKTIRQLQNQIEQQTKQIADLKKGSQSGGSQTDAEQQKKVAKLQGQIEEQQKQIASLQNDLKRAREESGSATNNSDKMKKKYEAQLADVNSQLNSCRSDLAEMKAQINAKNEEIKRLGNKASSPDESAELKSLRIQVNDLTSKEAACRKECEKLQRFIDQNSNSDAEKQALQNEIKDLNKEVATLTNRVENLQNQNAELINSLGQGGNADFSSYQKTIDELNAEVEAQRQQIAQMNAELQQKNSELEAAKKNSGTKASTGSVNQKIQELQQMCDSYLAEIERLRAENELLKSENAQLKDKVASSADLYAENERLQQKVKLASVLVTSDLKVTPGKNIKTGNVVSSTNKAKKTNVIRIDCRILDNNVIDPGSITIYARIADAANRVIANGQPESFDMSGVQMQYTLKQDIEFTGYGRNLAMIWKKAEGVELAPGLYWMTLYSGGYEIGKVSFKLD